MEIYVHQRGKEPILVAVDEGTRIGDLIGRFGTEGDSAWVGDTESPLSIEQSLGAAAVENRAHIHVGRCHRINVSVDQAGTTLTRHFPPGATVAAVFAWATGPHGFNLSSAERAKHTLILCGTNVEPDRSTHVGTLAGDDCELCLSLVPKERFEG